MIKEIILRCDNCEMELYRETDSIKIDRNFINVGEAYETNYKGNWKKRILKANYCSKECFYDGVYKDITTFPIEQDTLDALQSKLKLIRKPYLYRIKQIKDKQKKREHEREKEKKVDVIKQEAEARIKEIKIDN